ncbi:hypothetical protein PHACT_11245 [Pseudohongiella acticola]|uniref:Uncharacterized protein n=1 Tax=Pseudohongiella acticola TaxID=1524254 RepID=A0A1E8CMH8_9GAMM|nr:hypothetical protein [Pseudohongiella acticola]OFE13639.1 hypothetical protein PHACT_11245 [Pseudohongiella acticola]
MMAIHDFPWINLMPWRDARQMRRCRLFVASLTGLMTITLIAVAGAAALGSGLVSGQAQRNARVGAGMTALQQRIGAEKTVFAQHQQRQTINARARQLHAARIQQARLLPGLTTSMPDGVRLDELQYTLSTVELQGTAGSALQVERWRYLLELREDAARAELQLLQLLERQTQTQTQTQDQASAQIYRYRIIVRLSAAGFETGAPGAVP